MPFVGRAPRVMVQHAKKSTKKILDIRELKEALPLLRNQTKTKRLLAQPAGRSYILIVYQDMCIARPVLRHKSQKQPQTHQFRYDQK